MTLEVPLDPTATVPRVTVVVTVRNEGDAVVQYLDHLLEAITLSCEVLVVYDHPEDTTVPWLVEYSQRDRRVVPVENTYGIGPARAIRYGIDHASAPVIVVTMADGCDDPAQIDSMVRLVERGIAIAAASRYMRGGRQIGGPALKSTLSRLAGISLYLLARVGTHDATNSFKAYSAQFIREVGIESDAGFEVGIELVAKARRRRERVAEIPTIWLERTYGSSNFKVAKWAPRYLRWYFHAFGPRERPLPGPAVSTLASASLAVDSLEPQEPQEMTEPR
jgi:dolichol-phosphate mannosyltransferase